MMNRAALNPSTTRYIPGFSRSLYLLGAALLLLTLQLLSATDPVYALLVFVLLWVSYKAILWAGGLSSLFGLCIFYLLLQHVLISQIAKVVFWEPADTPLRQPIITIGVYIVGMAGLAGGAFLARRATARRTRPIFEAETQPRRILLSALLSIGAYTAIALATSTVGTDTTTGGAIQGGVLGPLKQLTFLGPLAVSYGTVYHLRVSGGKHSLGWANGLPIVIQFSLNLVSGGRSGLVFPLIIYLGTCFAYRYAFRWKHYLAAIALAYMAIFILFPFALFARNVTRTGNFEKNVQRASELALDVVSNPLKYHDLEVQSEEKEVKTKTDFSYYSHKEATLGRYTVLPVVDGVVDAAVKLGTTGMDTITPGFEMLLPRFLFPEKPFANTGNLLAHRAPGLMPNKNDYSTGITMGFFADAFTSFSWLGLVVISGLIMFLFQAIYTCLIGGRIWRNALLPSFVAVIWGFSEATISGLTLSIFQGPFIIATGLFALRLLVNILERITDRTKATRQANRIGPSLHRLNPRLLSQTGYHSPGDSVNPAGEFPYS